MSSYLDKFNHLHQHKVGNEEPNYGIYTSSLTAVKPTTNVSGRNCTDKREQPVSWESGVHTAQEELKWEKQQKQYLTPKPVQKLKY